MQTKLPPLLQATSGALGSAVGNFIVFPLDVATTRMQHASKKPKAKRLSLILTLHRLLSRRHALTRIYSGFKADTLSSLLSSFIYFYTYTALQKGLHQYRLKQAVYQAAPSPAGVGGLSSKASDIASTKRTPLEELIIGVLAGVTSKGIVLPISTVSVRQQVRESGEDEKRSVLQTLLAISQEDGLKGLFSGLGPTIPLTLLPSLTLYIHSLLLRILVPERHRAHPPGVVTFLLGALSNALATIPLYPLILVKVLDQSGKEKENDKENQESMFSTMKKFIRREGIQGLYVGLEGQLVKGLVSQGVMMLVKQRVEERVIKFYRARS
ncbi:hypothetical protein C343_02523 [Cryptococcus neoformans C23]|uniref:Solute carrier family 25 (Peroxisomal adenine nucleotide transporter), member 17 n=2 Tax=Cryptococcus neoformans TaxID=5207 RepID=A0A854QCV8_CRYNE|nr:hypothetical protein CNAG_05178 [Cryptococcus neoformans var. grubii H99]AUB24101.1 hypothetical protein CKF44_05178 [Cryptococcus neoformans var. grubii]OWZ33561.1 hypothetical protein C347_02591 [Cryptococcus neoformans var. grubii AD2-60a]OWZ45657.1 hypothetical protein C343_02523 [Cryptococcus neoformans var. grubii C23]OXG24034.1 hypothetical protein C361_02583 [Cryptococcus neoformans var. grubii Tu259-1]OXG83832.1 hypothetical protein C350_02310 [Cryptococcus neoformans var. grubii M|eukprot:XP_012048533.1 hypothetical protein CNAG_05178 [Cryptococcus neoformans var. grubii H99]